jgi:hypothetical protein
MTTNNNKKILVDIIVADCMIRVLKPVDQSLPLPTSTEDKILFCNTVPADRLKHRVSGRLKGKALVQAADLVSKYGNISTSGECGSIYVDETDSFVQ